VDQFCRRQGALPQRAAKGGAPIPDEEIPICGSLNMNLGINRFQVFASRRYKVFEWF
jgi:hypothetical protein